VPVGAPDGAGAAGDQPATCPSGRCREGAVLLGVVGPDGRLGYVTPALAVDADFVRTAGAGRTPESRFRFAEPCAEAACDQWGDGECGLIGEILSSARGAALAEAPVGLLPRCAIRRSCRWYAQRGARACAVCPHVVHTARVPGE
jgi:hypothetical protein